MKLDNDLTRAIKKEANGDGSREAKFAFLKRVEQASKDLSTSEVAQGGFDAAIKKHGRVPVAVCVAATLYERRERLGNWKFSWAVEVLNLWTNRPLGGIDRAAIRDTTLHPTKICDYAASFIRLTTEEP